MKKSVESYVDDSSRVMGAITAGMLAAFAVTHEMMPAEHQEVVIMLGSTDFVFNVACWLKFSRNADSAVIQELELKDEPASLPLDKTA